MERARSNGLGTLGRLGATRESGAAAWQAEYAAPAATQAFPGCNGIALITCVARSWRGSAEVQQAGLCARVVVDLKSVIVLPFDVQTPRNAHDRSCSVSLALL